MTLPEGDAPTWVSRILEAEALRSGPSAATKQAIAAGLAAARAARPAPRPPSLRISRSRAIAALAGAFTIGAFLGAGLARTAAPPAPESHAPSTPVALVPSPAETPPASPSPSPTSSELVSPGPSALPLPKAKGPAPTPSSLETQERSWLERARSAIARGDGPAALAALETHERNHPASAFVEERDALYVQALAKAARHEEANRAADRFEASYPQSIFLGSVRASRVPRAVPGDAR